jgi:hypothetical protein
VDYELVFTIGVVSIGGLIGGALITIGLIEVRTGGAIVKRHRPSWSSREARLLGLSRVIQGVAIAVYPLFAGLSLSAHLIPLFWVGHIWGFLVPSSPFFVIFGTLFFQAVLERRSERATHQ